MEVTRYSKEVLLTQQLLIENLAAAHGISGIKHSIPCELTVYQKHEGKTN